MNKPIRSFVLRAGRMTKRQEQGLAALAKYALAPEAKPWDFTSIFGRNAATIVEIGFGMGHSLVKMAAEQAQFNFLGIEVHRPGVGSLVEQLEVLGLSNVRIVTQDAVTIFRSHIPADSLAGIQIFFPDPWPKKRHHKRRLIQPAFVELLVSRLKVDGFIHCATDWQDYALQMRQVLSENGLLYNQSKEDAFSLRPATRPLTKFEQRGLRLGHEIYDLVYRRRNIMDFG